MDTDLYVIFAKVPDICKQIDRILVTEQGGNIKYDNK